MSGAKKVNSEFSDPLNSKIQRKFDSVFEQTSKPEKASTLSLSEEFDGDISFGTDTQEEMIMEKKNSKPTIDLDLSNDGTSTGISKPKIDEGIDFNINFEIEDLPEKTAATSTSDLNEGGFSLEEVDIGEVDFNEITKKTLIIDTKLTAKPSSEIPSFDPTASINEPSASSDSMSREEARTNIETTIKDILRPKSEGTKDSISLEELKKGDSPIDQIEDSVLDFSHTPSKGFVLAEIADEAFIVANKVNAEKTDPNTQTNTKIASNSNEVTGEFDLEALRAATDNDEESGVFSLDDDDKTVLNIDRVFPVKSPKVESATMVDYTREAISKDFSRDIAKESTRESPRESSRDLSPGMNSEDSVRFQATIRSLREEREELIATIKSLKSESKEVEQDNLTLKANLDEAKIEITILRKRHMVELEDMKYRLAMSEEKKAMSVELARQADLRREKLEQKVRIDFNQVKQREKELESKLELLSMDVDSQVQSRDHKILELRRKIDALEFNMENASIKEQKSLDDKRKLEDRLNKIMKTLRHSIKNLEDDIDHMEDDGEQEKDKI